jgi:simple sugar transport system ATP-binding protein
LSGIVKRFPGVVANAGVDFELRPGEIHSLLGENGAGKTTLMKIAYGLYEPDEGEIHVWGRKVRYESAREAIRDGLGMVHQHFKLIHPFTVAENMVLGQGSPRAPLLEDKQGVSERIRRISEQYGLTVDPDAEVWTLSVGEQQRVEIVKALYRGAEVLILDEPTAVLTPQEADELLEIVRRLAEDGKSVVFISHKLEEVLRLSDRVTVLRDGHVVGTVPARESDRHGLACMMVGRDVVFQVSKGPANPEGVVLEVDGLSVEDDRGLLAVKDLSLEVRSGEILGIAGVAGNGQAELEEALAGLRRSVGGTVRICGRDTTNKSTRFVADCGLAHIPSDRYERGLLPDFSVAENLVLERFDREPFSVNGRLRWSVINQEAKRLAAEFDVRTPSVKVQASKLSGGNAQKLILARELARDPKVLLAAQPTRGLDVSAIEFVHRTLVEQRDAGMGVLLFSTELDEIMQLSDRIAVICDGTIVSTVPADQVDVNQLGLMMGGSNQCANF